MTTRRGSGTWLLLATAGHDPEASAVALAAIKELRGQVRLALRLLGDSEGLRTWHVHAAGELGGPLWLILQDGALAGLLRGPQTCAELVAAIRAALDRLSAP